MIFISQAHPLKLYNVRDCEPTLTCPGTGAQPREETLLSA